MNLEEHSSPERESPPRNNNHSPEMSRGFYSFSNADHQTRRQPGRRTITNQIVERINHSTSIQWMVSRFGLRGSQRNRSEVVSAGPSGYFSETEKELLERSTSCSEWPQDTTQYEVIRMLGFGATAKVYEAICKKTQRRCAIKKIFLDNDRVSLINLWRETRCMSLCNHENILRCHTSFLNRRDLWLIMDCMNGGSILDIIENCVANNRYSNGVLEERMIASIMKQVLMGLEYLHNLLIIHRDIKSGNILFNTRGNIKLADFGVSIQLKSATQRRYSFIGTPCWMAPEVLAQIDGYGTSADIWSLGITAIEMATGKVPNQKDPTLEVVVRIVRESSPSLDTVADHEGQYSQYTNTFRKFIRLCLRKHPQLRTPASSLLKSAFIRSAADSFDIRQDLVNLLPPQKNDKDVHPYYRRYYQDRYKNNHVDWDFTE